MQARLITTLFLGVAFRASLSYTDVPAIVQAYHGGLGPSVPLRQLIQPQHRLRESTGTTGCSAVCDVKAQLTVTLSCRPPDGRSAAGPSPDGTRAHWLTAGGQNALPWSAAADTISSVALHLLHIRWSAPGWDPGLLHCWNPLAVLTAAAGCPGSLGNAAQLCALCAAAYQHPLLAGSAAALGLLISPSSGLLLLVPLVLVLQQGAGRTQGSDAVPVKPTASLSGKRQRASWQLRGTGSLLVGLLASYSLLGLLVWHGAGRHGPREQDLLGRPTHVPQWAALGPELQGMSIVPSMGMAWYLAAEAFPSTLQVCHAALLLVPWLALLPLAVCLHQEPLLLWALAALGGCLFAPSPKSTDLLRCLSVLPLLGPLLQRVPSKVFMTQTLVAGLALHPAMMHSWLVQHTANANFAFAACALLAAWQVLLHLQLLNAVLAARETLSG